MGVWHSLTDPHVDRHLIADEGEVIVDEVRRHPIAFVLPVLIVIVGLAVVAALLLVPRNLEWLPLCLGAAIAVFGVYRMLATHMDRFVITNMRVFRVHGIFSQHTATMPMARILDISVHKPFIGRIFRYGHFVFESAAKEQGLRDIRFVGRPDERDLTIQRVIQQSGLRGGSHKGQAASLENDGTADVPDDEFDEFDDYDVDDVAEVDDRFDAPDRGRAASSGSSRSAASGSVRSSSAAARPSSGAARSGDIDASTEAHVPDWARRARDGEDDWDTGEKVWNTDAQEWNTLEIEPRDTGEFDSAEIRRRRLRTDPITSMTAMWASRWPESERMEAMSSLMRVHRLLVTDLDDRLRPLGLTLARFETLLLLELSPARSLPLAELMERVQVEATSATTQIRRLEEDGLLERVLQSGDDGEVVATITLKGRKRVERAGSILADARFGLGSLSEEECEDLTEMLAWPRMSAGDF